MKKALLLIILLGTLAFFAGYSQTLDWAFKIGSTRNDVAYDMVKDSLGNIYLTGGIHGTVNMNPNGATVPVTVSTDNYSNLFLARYDKDFHLIWIVALQEESTGAKLLVDDLLNVYILGSGSGIIDLDPTAGTSYYDCSVSNSFIAKYDGNGNFLTVKGIPALGQYPTNSKIFMDKDDNLFTYSNDTLNKFNKALQLLWTKRIEGNPVFFNQQDFVLIKNFKHWFNGEENSPTSLIYQSVDHVSGTLTDTKLYGDCNSYIGLGFLTRTKSDKLIIKARFWGKLNLYGNNDTISYTNSERVWSPYGGYPILRDFIACYDTLHNLLWAKDFVGVSPNPYLIETDEKGNIYTLGFLNFSANFNPDGSNRLTNNGYSNYIAKYDSSMNYIAAAQFLGGSYMEHIGAFLIHNDTALISGHFYNTIDMDLTRERFALTSSPTGYWDIFIGQYYDFNIVTVGTSIDESQTDSPAVTVFPNPSGGKFSIHANWDFQGSLIKVFDLAGNLVLNETVTTDPAIIDLTDFPPAVYLISLTKGQIAFRQKIIKN